MRRMTRSRKHGSFACVEIFAECSTASGSHALLASHNKKVVCYLSRTLNFEMLRKILNIKNWSRSVAKDIFKGRSMIISIIF